MPQQTGSAQLASEFQNTFANVLVTGAGVSGIGIARLLLAADIPVTLCDARPAVLEQVQATLPVQVVAQDAVAVRDYSCVITSPGWSPQTPLLADAAAAGVPIIGEVELAYILDRAELFGPRRTWVAITGTNGKTTTTSMVAHIATSAGLAARAVGNIGIPLADALLGAERVDTLVAEFSSFQLHWTQQFEPDIGVLLNIAEDHLDWHGGYTGYAAAKARVLRAPVRIYGAGDPGVQAVLAQPTDYGLPATVLEPQTSSSIGFDLTAPSASAYGLRDGYLCRGEHRIAKRDGIEPAGDAGSLDALAAAAVAHHLGISDEQIDTALHSFRVARHRGEVVAHQGEITVVDNSKATNPHAAVAALRGLEQVTWVAGGQLKGAETAELVQAIAPQLAAAVLLGVDREQLAGDLERYAPEVPVHLIDTTDPHQAMQEVAAAAVAATRPGGTIVLAPAAASLDMYQGMAQRGDMFAAALQQALAEHS